MLRATVCILIGVFLNVAVAWGCVLASNGTPRFEPPGAPQDLDQHDQQMLSEAGIKPNRSLDSLPKRKYFAREFNDYGWSAIIVLSNIYKTNGAWNPPYCGNELGYPATIIRAGWPMRSLTGFRNRSQWPDGLAYAIPLTESTMEFVPIRALPFAPLWPGFIVNTLAYALLAFAPFVGFPSLRRTLRRRRGLCAACSYPVGVSAVCTECGEPITRQPT